MFYGLFLLIISNVYSQGVERWDIKTLNDSSYKNITFDNSIETTIKNLSLVEKPLNLKNNTPRLDIEHQTFYLIVKVLECRKQSDGDYHLIICDTNDISKTMIAEVITPKYGNKIYYNIFKEVRDYLLARIRNKTLINRIYAIEGVVFFDLIHNQKGRAINGIEIHPVMYMERIK